MGHFGWWYPLSPTEKVSCHAGAIVYLRRSNIHACYNHFVKVLGGVERSLLRFPSFQEGSDKKILVVSES